MITFKISVYLGEKYIKEFFADFESKKQALSWTMGLYKDIGIILNPKEITIINPLA